MPLQEDVKEYRGELSTNNVEDYNRLSKNASQAQANPFDQTNPNYYKDRNIEVIDCIESIIGDKAPKEAFLVGQVVKYVSRYNVKNGVEDLWKADWYLQRLIRML